MPAAAAICFDRLDATGLLEALDSPRALVVSEHAQDAPAICPETTADVHLDDRQLYAVAEIGYQYLRSGGYRLAEVLFRGLTALAPSHGYFWLALGLAHDHLNDKRSAEHDYAEAARRSPDDPTPLVNLAELALERRNRTRAQALLGRARTKAVTASNPRMTAKIDALIRQSAASTATSTAPGRHKL